MTKQIINVGTAANSKNGDSLRSAFQKVNANFTELYAGGLGGGNIDLSAVNQHIIPATNLTYNLGSPTHKWHSLYVGVGSIYIGDAVLSLEAGKLNSSVGFSTDDLTLGGVRISVNDQGQIEAAGAEFVGVGSPGDPGADALWNWQGAYSAGPMYQEGDIVSYQGSTYRRNSTGNSVVGELPTNATYWQIVSQKGADGDGGDSYDQTLNTTDSVAFASVSVNGVVEAQDHLTITSTDVDALEEAYLEQVALLEDQFAQGIGGTPYTGTGTPASKLSYAALVRAKALNPLIPDAWIPRSLALRNAYYAWAAASITLTPTSSGFTLLNGGGVGLRYEEATGLRFPDNTYQTTAANTGDFTFNSTTMSVPNGDNIVIRATDNDGALRAQLLLDPADGWVRLLGRSNEDNYTFTGSNWDTASWSGTTLSFTGAADILPVLNNGVSFVTSVSINDGDKIDYDGYGDNGDGNITIYVNQSPDTDPIAITSIRIYVRVESRIEIDHDEGELNLIANDLNININSTQYINLRANDYAQLQSNNNYLWVENTGVYIDLAGEGGTNTWTFENRGTLRLPAGGDIIDSNGQSVLGGGGGGVLERTVNFPYGAEGDTRGTIALTPDGKTYMCVANWTATTQPQSFSATVTALANRDSFDDRINMLEIDLTQYPDLLTIWNNPTGKLDGLWQVNGIPCNSVYEDDGVELFVLEWPFVYGDSPNRISAGQTFSVSFATNPLPGAEIWRQLDSGALYNQNGNNSYQDVSLRVDNRDLTISAIRTDNDVSADVDLYADDDIEIQAGDLLTLRSGANVRISPNDGGIEDSFYFTQSGTLTFPDGTSQKTAYQGKGDMAVPAYKGFEASYARIFENINGRDEMALSKVVIYKKETAPMARADITGVDQTDDDYFRVNGLGGTDVVAMFVIYSNEWKAPEIYGLRSMVEYAIDNIILNGGLEGNINSVDDMKAAFYSNHSTLAGYVSTDASFEFYDNEWGDLPTTSSRNIDGTGLIVDIEVTGGNYTNITITDGGTGYFEGQGFKVLGEDLGGVDGVNDFTFYVSVDGNGTAIEISGSQGTAAGMADSLYQNVVNYQILGGSGLTVYVYALNNTDDVVNNLVSVGANSLGSGYRVDDIITVAGAAFGPSGVTPDNNTTFTVLTVGETGNVLALEYTQGTIPAGWPINNINDGGRDTYDGANYIYTNILGDSFLDNNGANTTAMPYSNGETSFNGDIPHFGPSADSAVVYKSGIFGVFAVNANIEWIGTNGGSGADGDSSIDCGSLYRNESAIFRADGSIELPTMYNTGYDSQYVLEGPTLKLGTTGQQTIITGPKPTSNNTDADRLVVQGQRGYGRFGDDLQPGEGGDVYLWGGVGGEGESYTDSGGSGGDIKVRGGQGQNNEGGYVKIEGGDAYHWNNTTSGDGGYVEITGGDVQGFTPESENMGGNTDNRGGDVNIAAGRAWEDETKSGVVNIRTGGHVVGESPDTHLWRFKNNGDLQLPVGGDIVNSNGTSVLGGAGVVTNEITNTDGAEQPSTYSVSVGTDGVITMVTSRGSIEFGAIPEVIGAQEHFHIMRAGGDNSDLFFGDDFNYVLQRGPAYDQNPAWGVEIGANDKNNGGQQVWRFGTDGRLTIPGEIKSAAGNNLSIGTPNGVPNSISSYSGGGGWNEAYTDLATTGGTGTGLTVDVAEGSGGYIDINSITINTPGTGYTDGDVITIENQSNLTATFTIGVPTPIWTFGTDGTLTLPEGGDILDSNGDSVLGGGGGDATGVSRSDDNLIIRLTDPEDDGLELRSIVADGNDADIASTVLSSDGFVISTNSNVDQKQWTFGNDGTLTLPDSMTIETTYGGTPRLVIDGGANYVDIRSDGNILIGYNESGGNVFIGNGSTGLVDIIGPKFRVQAEVPISSTGDIGDIAGQVAFDGSYIYYCTQNYGGTTYNVVHFISEGESANGSSNGYLVANTFQLPQVGWKVYYNGQVRTISQVNDGGTPGYYVVFVSEALVIPGQATFAWGPTPATNIWKRVAWSGDTW
jgi:hypothetical protein